MSTSDPLTSPRYWISIQECVAACWAFDMYSDIRYSAARYKRDKREDLPGWKEVQTKLKSKTGKLKTAWNSVRYLWESRDDWKEWTEWTEDLPTALRTLEKEATKKTKNPKSPAQNRIQGADSKDYLEIACQLRTVYWKQIKQIARYPTPAEVNRTESDLGFDLKASRNDYSLRITDFHQKSDELIRSIRLGKIFPQESEIQLNNYYKKLNLAAYQHVAKDVLSVIENSGGEPQFFQHLVKMTLLGRWDAPSYSLWSFFMFLETYIRLLSEEPKPVVFYSNEKSKGNPRFLLSIEEELTSFENPQAKKKKKRQTSKGKKR